MAGGGIRTPCPLRDKTLSRRPRYNHFGTSPQLNLVQNILCLPVYLVGMSSSAVLRPCYCTIYLTAYPYPYHYHLFRRGSSSNHNHLIDSICRSRIRCRLLFRFHFRIPCPHTFALTLDRRDGPLCVARFPPPVLSMRCDMGLIFVPPLSAYGRSVRESVRDGYALPAVGRSRTARTDCLRASCRHPTTVMIAIVVFLLVFYHPAERCRIERYSAQRGRMV